MRISSGVRLRARKVVIIGVHGSGKSSLAAQFTKPFFFDKEEGTDSLDVARNADPILSTDQLIGDINWLAANQHDFKSVVLDTADWINQMATMEVRGGRSLTDAQGGYGRGKEALTDKWQMILKHLDHLRQVRQMNCLILAHCKVAKVNDPMVGTYDKYISDMPAEIDSLIQEWADEVLFIRFKLNTRTEDLGFNKERNMVLGGSEREILTCDSPSASAKNRCGLPPVMPFHKTDFFKTYSAYVKALKPVVVEQKPEIVPPGQAAIEEKQAGNIAGIVVDGSSKKKEPSPETEEARQLLESGLI